MEGSGQTTDYEKETFVCATDVDSLALFYSKKKERHWFLHSIICACLMEEAAVSATVSLR